MGIVFPHLNQKEVYDLILYHSNYYLLLKTTLLPSTKKILQKEYTHLLTLDEALDKGMLFTLLSKGTSLLKKPAKKLIAPFSEKAIVTYHLSSLSHSKKTQFGYALRGRGIEGGLLSSLKANMIGRNALILPANKLEELVSFFSTWKVAYSYFSVYQNETKQGKNVDNQHLGGKQ